MNDRHIFIHGDICDADLVNQLLQDYEIDTIVHFAAETHVDRSISDPGSFIRTNVWGLSLFWKPPANLWLQNPL